MVRVELKYVYHFETLKIVFLLDKFAYHLEEPFISIRTDKAPAKRGSLY